jgi:hypothetical protein
LAGAPGRRGQSIFLKKNQNDVVLVKKKKSQQVATEFLTGFCRVNPSGHDFSYFFINPARFQPRIGQVSG